MDIPPRERSSRGGDRPDTLLKARERDAQTGKAASTTARHTQSQSATLDLHAGVSRGDAPAVEAALRQGGDADAADPRWKRTPLILACAKGDADVVAALLAGGADVEAETRHGARALAYAGRSGNLASSVRATFFVAVPPSGAGSRPRRGVDIPRAGRRKRGRIPGCATCFKGTTPAFRRCKNQS